MPVASRIIGAIAAAELPIVILAAPALLFPSPSRLLVLLVIPIVWSCNRRVTGHSLPQTPLNVPMFILLMMVLVSLVVTPDIRFSLDKVSGMVLGTTLYWASTRWVTTPRRLRAAVSTFVMAGATLGFIGLLGTNWFNKFPLIGSIVERLPPVIRGVPGAAEGFQPNPVGGCLVLFIPLQVALLSAPARGWLISGLRDRRATLAVIGVQALLLALTAGTLILTQSRGALMGITIAFLAFLGWYSRKTRLLVALVLGAAAVATLMLGPARVLNATVDRFGTGAVSSVSGRAELWSRAIYGIEDFPITGMGMNIFRRVLPILYPTFLTSPIVDVAHAHNHFLQAALDLGLPGLIAYASLWVLAGAMLVIVCRTAEDSAHRAVAGGISAGLIAHFVFSMSDAIPLGAKVGVLFWLTLALATALHEVTLGSRTPTA